MREYNILGIRIKGYGLREQMKVVDVYLKNGALNTILYITTKMLVEAAENEEQKIWLESMDMTVAAETDILKAMGIRNRSWLSEVEEGAFLTEFLRRMTRYHKSLFLIADTEDSMSGMEHFISECEPSIPIAGTYILNDLKGSVDTLINEINDVVPGVIFSNLSIPEQEELIYENKMKVNADVWLALTQQSFPPNYKKKRKASITERFYKILFKKRMNRYQNQNT